MNKPLVAVILAGGVGKRFWPIKTYKARLPFLGKPLISHIVEELSNIGVTDAIIVTSPKEAVHVRDVNHPGTKITYVVQEEPKGMGDALMCARKAIGTQSCLVLNAEDVVEKHLYEMLSLEMKKNEPFIVGKKVSTYVNTGYLAFEKDRLVSIVEKPGKGNEPSDMVNLVFHYFPNPEMFFEMLAQTASEHDDVYEKALSQLLKVTSLHVLGYEGAWIPLKYPWHVLDVMECLLQTKVTSHRGTNVEIRSNVIIDGPVYIDDNVRIFEHTKIVGPCYIGKNTIIGNNNMIRDSMIGSSVVTGFNTDITRSYVGDNCWFHCNYIGDSVLEGNVSMGSGANLANLRLDEEEIYSAIKGERVGTGRHKLGAIIARHVRIGSNATIMPGIKIGSNTFIGAGVTLDRDVPDNSFCINTPSYEIKTNTKNISEASREVYRKNL